MLPHDVCPRSVIDKPHYAPLKLDSQLHKAKLPKSGESSRPGGSNIRPRSRAPRYDSHQRVPDPGLAIAHTVDPPLSIGKALLTARGESGDDLVDGAR